MNNFNFDGFNVDEARDLAFEVYNDGLENCIVHDDGFMHVSFEGNRYAFDIGQESSRIEYNNSANRILRSIGVIGNVTGENN